MANKGQRSKITSVLARVSILQRPSLMSPGDNVDLNLADIFLDDTRSK